MPAKDLDKIAALLTCNALDKQVAAAIVLGEIEAKSPVVKKGLKAMLDSGVAPLQRHALDAWTRIGARPILSDIIPLLTSRDPDVSQAAERAIASVGESAIPLVRERMAAASPRERRALESALTHVGGKEAFWAVLSGLYGLKLEAAKAVAAELRQQIKLAEVKTRRAYLTQVEKFLKLKKTQADAVAVATSLRLIGFLEEPKAVPALLSYATARKWGTEIRLEALAALRLARGSKPHEARVVSALLEIAERDGRDLARAALYTLGSLRLPASSVPRLERIAGHTDLDRARVAIELLGRDATAQATQALVNIISTGDRVRAELAATTLQGRNGAATKLVDALAEVDDQDRARMVQRALKPHAGELSKAQRSRLLERAVDGLAAGKPGWEGPLQIVREADPRAAADALRELVAKAARGKKADRAVAIARVLCRYDHATHQDRYRLAALELAQGRHDTHPASRSRDPALRALELLANDGFEVGAALSKDRSIGLETKYYVGFHFVEEGHPLGEELLADVAKKGGRTKIGKMAKNKLGLALRDA